MEQIIRTGIPALDELIEGSSSVRRVDERTRGFHLPSTMGATSSVCILGPDGTGKSVLAFHITSRYFADSTRAGTPPHVVYVSTDLSHAMASQMWHNFRLDEPNRRVVPFFAPEWDDSSLKVELKAYSPLDMNEVADFLRVPQDRICFFDLASKTGGDDWGMLERFIASLDGVKDDSWAPMVLVDSVEGFETLSGDLDAFGERVSRRSRLARLVRIATGKCHLVLIAEEPEEGQRLAEQFIADVVIRLRSTLVKGYVRRTIELEKVRGQAHRRGQHYFTIRSGAGSTTGKVENPDDPRVRLDEAGNTQSYLHVFPSLHRLSRRIIEDPSDFKVEPPEKKYAAFGITYLDETLEGAAPGAGPTRNVDDGSDTRGLPWSSLTALIGDAGTQKTWLGYAFLARCFLPYARRLFSAATTRHTKRLLRELCPNVQESDVEQARSVLWSVGPNTLLQDLQRFLSSEERIDIKELGTIVGQDLWSFRLKELARVLAGAPQGEFLGPEVGDLVNLLIRLGSQSTVERRIARYYFLSGVYSLGAPHVSASDGIPVLLTTNDVHHVRLAGEFDRWVTAEMEAAVGDLQAWADWADGTRQVFSAAMRSRVRRVLVCRRFEVHDTSSSVLLHTIDSAIHKAQDLILGEPRRRAAQTRERFHNSGRIRIVLDDFGALRQMYADVRNDTTFLPFLVFRLGREGVTGLIIDTHPGQPDLPTPELLESELRGLVQQRLYTWRVSFFGQNRVAITAIPPISKHVRASVRELKWFSGRADHNAVDPHFDMYVSLDEPRPQAVPLEVRLFAETPAFERYRSQENAAWSELFTPRRDNDSSPGDIIVSDSHMGYEALRELCHLQRDILLDYTLVFQIDEFWAMDGHMHCSHDPDDSNSPVERARADDFPGTTLRKQFAYLNSITTNRSGDSNAIIDPYGVFRHKKVAPRREFFVYPGSDDGEGAGCIDRIPFMWDFGFLLYRRRPWEAAKGMTIKTGSSTSRLVGDIMTSPQVNWREYLGACRSVADAEAIARSVPVTAFDLSLLAPQSLSCLLFEIWLSEIYTTKQLRKERPEEWAQTIGSRPWSAEPTANLVSLLTTYQPEFYMAWLLLVEVLPLSTFVETNPDEIAARDSDSNGVATRHWYKTATKLAEAAREKDPVSLRRLPGRFSTRGDWFLAVAAGSRSGVLADRALDLLSSRRANFARLHLGLGLPTREIASQGQYEQVKTALHLVDEHGSRRNVSYGEMREYGQKENSEGFWWFWRSSLASYDFQAKVWEKLLTRFVLMWNSVRDADRSKWINCFEVYDWLYDIRKARLESAALSELDQKHVEEFKHLPSRERCVSLTSFFQEQLIQATPMPWAAQWDLSASDWARDLFSGLTPYDSEDGNSETPAEPVAEEGEV